MRLLAIRARLDDAVAWLRNGDLPRTLIIPPRYGASHQLPHPILLEQWKAVVAEEAALVARVAEQWTGRTAATVLVAACNRQGRTARMHAEQYARFEHAVVPGLDRNQGGMPTDSPSRSVEMTAPKPRAAPATSRCTSTETSPRRSNCTPVTPRRRSTFPWTMSSGFVWRFLHAGRSDASGRERGRWCLRDTSEPRMGKPETVRQLVPRVTATVRKRRTTGRCSQHDGHVRFRFPSPFRPLIPRTSRSRSASLRSYSAFNAAWRTVPHSTTSATVNV